MARSFWGFGSTQPTAAFGDSKQSSQAPPGTQTGGVFQPPSGPFAQATTAVSQASADPNVEHAPAHGGGVTGASQPLSLQFGAQAAGSGAGATQTIAATPGRALAMRGGSQAANINIPPAATLQGKLRVRVLEARRLDVRSPASNPYVVVNCSTSEHVSRSANTGAHAGIAIPQQNQHHSSSRLNLRQDAQQASDPANPSWQDEAIFDVTSYESNLEIIVYDAGDNERFLGWAKIRPDFTQSRSVDVWHRLEPRAGEPVSGEVHVSLRFEHTSKQHYGPADFQVLRLIGKGTFGQVYQVRKQDSARVYAMKVLSKRVIVQKKEIAHTIGERDILVRTSGAGSPFLVGLKFSFQTTNDLYLVTDYMSGGELFWHLQREGRFPEARAKFYIAELVLALEHLHNNDIVYRDLKPENILLDASGHVALCDFGLSKANLHNGTTNTFCGTTEYLAPEVLLDDKGYTKMVDFWSLGVLIFEMTCGWSPFYAEDNQQMYKNIAFGKVRFPKDALSPEGRDFVKGLLNRNPKHRLGATNDAKELMAHPFFRDVDWESLRRKLIPPPYKPHVTSDDDTSNFDPEFTNASTSVLTRNAEVGGTPLSPGIQDRFKGFTFVDDTLMDEYFRGKNSGPGSMAPVSASYRGAPPKMSRDDAIDLYDENEIKLSHSFYDSGIKHKFANAPPNDDDMGRLDEGDEGEGDADMTEDEHQDDRHYDDFVEGQGFEI